MKATVFVDVLSHWCLAAVPALEALSASLDDGLQLEVVIAPIGDGAPLGYVPEAEAWFYARGTLAYGTTLSSAWYESSETSTWAANAAAAAAMALGAEPVHVVRRLSTAAMRSGVPLAREPEAVRAAAALAGVGEGALREAMRAAELEARLRAGNERLAAIGCNERPSWHFVSANGDFAVLQGVWQAEAILPLAHALRDDERAYERAGAMPSF